MPSAETTEKQLRLRYMRGVAKISESCCAICKEPIEAWQWWHLMFWFHTTLTFDWSHSATPGAIRLNDGLTHE